MKLSTKIKLFVQNILRANFSVRAKLFAILIIVPYLIASVFIIFTAYFLHDIEVENMRTDIKFLAEDIIKDTDKQISEAMEETKTIANMLIIEDYQELDTALITQKLNNIIASHKVFNLILITDTAGNILAANNISYNKSALNINFLNRNYTNEMWFQHAKFGYTNNEIWFSNLKNNQLITNLYVDAKLGLEFAAPIYNAQQEVSALLFAQTDYQRMITENINLFENKLQNTYPDMLIFLCNETNKIIFPYNKNIPQDKTLFVSDLEKGAIINYKYHQINADNYLYSSATHQGSEFMNKYRWQTIIMIPKIEFNFLNIFTNRQTLILQAILLAIIICIIFFANKFSKYFNNLIFSIKNSLDMLAKGKINSIENNDIKNDEFNEIILSINKLSTGLSDITIFLTKIGDGDLNTEYKLFSSEDEIGSALKNMQRNMLAAKKEEEKRKQKDENMIWETNCLAQISDTLRKNNKDIYSLSYSTLNNLIAFTNSIQGAIYLHTQDEISGKEYLEMTAAFAWKRKLHFLYYKQELATDLISQCFIDKRTIILKELPKNFITIKSGLGKAEPTNILIVPIMLNENITGVIELASFIEYQQYIINFLEKSLQSFALTVINLKSHLFTTRLLETTQEQNQRLMQQEEELRQNFEKIRMAQEELANKDIYQQNEIHKLNKANEEKMQGLRMQQKEIIKQADEIALQNQHITDSIQYAKRIQSALLPPQELLTQLFKNHFILYLPRDIVAGDFYWIYRHNYTIYVAAADCTGHGVPGGFLSMLGIAFLNNIILKQDYIIDTSYILEELRTLFIQTLRQDCGGKEKDGMDISICAIHYDKQELQFSGAYNQVYIIRKFNDDGFVNSADIEKHISDDQKDELFELIPDKMPIGIFAKKERSFKYINFKYNNGDTLYMFSDGYVSQFGGKKNTKFYPKKFRDLLMSVHEMDFEQQRKMLENNLLEWQGERKRIDDILVMGIDLDFN